MNPTILLASFLAFFLVSWLLQESAVGVSKTNDSEITGIPSKMGYTKEVIHFSFFSLQNLTLGGEGLSLTYTFFQIIRITILIRLQIIYSFRIALPKPKLESEHNIVYKSYLEGNINAVHSHLVCNGGNSRSMSLGRSDLQPPFT